MSRVQNQPESWKRMVLRSMPPPAWLSHDAPHGDVVLSSRCRFMRNLRGFRFPHHATREELFEVQRAVTKAFLPAADTGIEEFKNLSFAERDYLVGCRLVSPDFPWDQSGRSVLMDKSRTVSVMINEEDHVRVQALTAGWSAENAAVLAEDMVNRIERHVEYAQSPKFGYLGASPFNAGQGRRLSGMFHLIGLAHGKRLPSVLKALAVRGIAARGLFGESSRAIGAFVQVSTTGGSRSEFVGACEYLMREERESRKEVGRDALESRARSAIDYAISSPIISIADALRVLGWARWAATAELPGLKRNPREVDGWLTTLEHKGASDNESASRDRATYLRRCLEN